MIEPLNNDVLPKTIYFVYQVAEELCPFSSIAFSAPPMALASDGFSFPSLPVAYYHGCCLFNVHYLFAYGR